MSSMVIEINELVKDYERLIDKLKMAKTKSAVDVGNVGEALRFAEKTCLKTDEFLSGLRGAEERVVVEKPFRVLLDYVFIIQIPYVLRLLDELRIAAVGAGDSDTVSKLNGLIDKFRSFQTY